MWDTLGRFQLVKHNNTSMPPENGSMFCFNKLYLLTILIKKAFNPSSVKKDHDH